MGLPNKDLQDSQRLNKRYDQERLSLVFSTLFLGISITFPACCYVFHSSLTITLWIVAIGLWLGLVHLYIKASQTY